MRRIVKWIISEEPLPGRVPFWEAGADDIKVVA